VIRGHAIEKAIEILGLSLVEDGGAGGGSSWRGEGKGGGGVEWIWGSSDGGLASRGTYIPILGRWTASMSAVERIIGRVRMEDYGGCYCSRERERRRVGMTTTSTILVKEIPGASSNRGVRQGRSSVPAERVRQIWGLEKECPSGG
jgi:hypothetical protein